MRRKPDWFGWVSIALVAAAMFYFGIQMRDAWAQEAGDYVLVPRAELEKFLAAYIEMQNELENAQRTIQSLRASLACT